MLDNVINKDYWLGLMIGNSRLHWSYFQANDLRKTWNTSQVNSLNELPQVVDEELKTYLRAKVPLYIASVVPSATKIYLPLPQTRIIDSCLIPLNNVYPTMGIDRILALWGSGCRYGFPSLVIDSGTALTITGADENNKVVGGAILPGVKLQLQSLFLNTASLPEIEIITGVSSRWANNTPCAIQSGVIHTIVAGIKEFTQDWLNKYPQSQVILTGGDAVLLSESITSIYPGLSDKIIVDTNLIFYAMESYRQMYEGN